jgi:aldehyde:ferredoxin oxidoreductase
MEGTLYGYAGRLARVDLSAGRISEDLLDLEVARKWVGGAGLGAKILLEEVPAGVEWDDPENRLVLTAGPLAGTRTFGSGTFNAATKGPMTNLAVISQANGFFGAYLRMGGFDGMVLQGRSEEWVYLWIHDGRVEVRPAKGLLGLDAWETEDAVRSELGLGEHDVSVYAIGPAGENAVRYAAIVGDRGHVASKNGVGAVMGAKRVKAFAASRGSFEIPVFDPVSLRSANLECFEAAKAFGTTWKWGTGGGFSNLARSGALPVKNYTTSLYPEHESMNGQTLRTKFEVRSMPCFRCAISHVKEVTVTEGPYKGFTGEEPEYEQLAAWGPQIGNTDLGATVMLTREVDRLGLDCNEASWTIGWAMECFEKGVFSLTETGGLDLSWGNVEAVRELLGRIARREGFLGDLLAEGVMRASRKIGGPAAQWGVHTMKGFTPRGHDHRGGGRWPELFDTCVSDTGTIQASWSGIHPQFVDLPPLEDAFDHAQVSRVVGDFSGYRTFDDCLGICRLAAPHPKPLLACFNAVTGWGWALEDAHEAGLRVITALRLFNLRHGHDPENERPSARYGSVPVDGPAEGRDIMAGWAGMKADYYRRMGFDPETGIPTPQTLSRLGLEEYAPDGGR